MLNLFSHTHTLSLSLPLLRRGFSRGPDVSPSVGHPVLDQLHHLHYIPAHGGPDPKRGLQPGGGGHHVRGRPSQSVRTGRVPEVSEALLQCILGWRMRPCLIYCFCVFELTVNLVFTNIKRVLVLIPCLLKDVNPSSSSHTNPLLYINTRNKQLSLSPSPSLSLHWKVLTDVLLLSVMRARLCSAQELRNQTLTPFPPRKILH